MGQFYFLKSARNQTYLSGKDELENPALKFFCLTPVKFERGFNGKQSFSTN